MGSLHSRKAEERCSPEQRGRQDASAEFSSVAGAAVGFAVSFMSHTDSCESCIQSLSNGHLKTTGNSTGVTFWIPILKALALEDPLPPAIHERSCTEVGKVLNQCVRIAFALKFLSGLFINMKLLFVLIGQIHIQAHMYSWQRSVK